MRLLLGFLAVVVFAKAKSDSTSVGGLRDRLPVEWTRRNTYAETEDVPSNPKKEGDACDIDSLNNMVCEDDKLIFCGPNERVMSTPCMFNGRQGFCNCEKTACVPQKPVCQNEAIDCLQPKLKLPDNLDCHSYTYCTPDKKKIQIQCPGNLIYDPNAEKCMDMNTARCLRVPCPRPGNSVRLVPFPQAPNYYVLCYQGLGAVRKCTDTYYSVQNNSCQFDCKLKKDSGLFKDTNIQKCKQGYYYACRRAGTAFTTVQVKCPAGHTFNEEMGLCTAEDNCTEPEGTS